MKLEQIKKDVEKHTGLSNIESQSRKNNYVLARWIYIDLSYWFTNSTYEEIAFLIDRDHSTMTHAIRNIDNVLKYEPEFKRIYDLLDQEYSKNHRKRRKITANNDNTVRLKNKIIKYLNTMSRKELKKLENHLTE